MRKFPLTRSYPGFPCIISSEGSMVTLGEKLVITAMVDVTDVVQQWFLFCFNDFSLPNRCWNGTPIEMVDHRFCPMCNISASSMFGCFYKLLFDAWKVWLRLFQLGSRFMLCFCQLYYIDLPKICCPIFVFSFDISLLSLCLLVPVIKILHEKKNQFIISGHCQSYWWPLNTRQGISSHVIALFQLSDPNIFPHIYGFRNSHYISFYHDIDVICCLGLWWPFQVVREATVTSILVSFPNPYIHAVLGKS